MYESGLIELKVRFGHFKKIGDNSTILLNALQLLVYESNYANSVVMFWQSIFRSSIFFNFHTGKELRVCEARVTPFTCRAYINLDRYMQRSARFSLSTPTCRNQMSVVMVCQTSCSVVVDQALSTKDCHKRNTSWPLEHQLRHVGCSV